MNGNTPKLIKKMIDDVEAAQADIKSGDPTLMLHGFTALVSIMTEQMQMLEVDYPEQRRMREFAENQIRDLEKSRDMLADHLERDKQAQERRDRWRVQHALDEAERLLREKERKAEDRRIRKLIAEENAKERAIRQAKDAEEAARQHNLFEDGSSKEKSE